MSRVYLFADFGKGPRVVARLSRWRGAMGPEPFSSAATIRDNASAWWLVECESAEAGRKAIQCHQSICQRPATVFDCRKEPCDFGRVIAEGGKS